jgi:hypothetical protein
MADANKLKFPFLIGDSLPSNADTGQFFLNKLNGNYYYWDGSTWRPIGGGGGGATRFLDLTDTPNTYTGSALKGVRVNATETGLEFYTAVDTDEKVKADASDPTAGYLDDKIDGTTIKLDGVAHKIYVDGSAFNGRFVLRTGDNISGAYDYTWNVRNWQSNVNYYFLGSATTLNFHSIGSCSFLTGNLSINSSSVSIGSDSSFNVSASGDLVINTFGNNFYLQSLGTSAALYLNAYDHVSFLINGAEAMRLLNTSDLSMNSHRIKNLLDPVDPQDAATKNYVDNMSFVTINTVQTITADKTIDANLHITQKLTVDGPVDPTELDMPTNSPIYLDSPTKTKYLKYDGTEVVESGPLFIENPNNLDVFLRSQNNAAPHGNLIRTSASNVISEFGSAFYLGDDYGPGLKLSTVNSYDIGLATNNKTRISVRRDGAVIVIERYDVTYKYFGDNGCTILPLPYGIFYSVRYPDPLHKDLIQELYINDVQITNWRYLNYPTEENGVGIPGRGAYGGFAHSIVLTDGTVVNNGDNVRMVLKFKKLISPTPRGIRVGPDAGSWGEELTKRGSTYPTNDHINPRSFEVANNTIYYTPPTEVNVLPVIFSLSKKQTGPYSRRRASNGKPFHQGHHWRPRAYGDNTGKFTIDTFLNKHLPAAYKLGFLHTETGAISDPSTETILLKKTYQPAPFYATLVLR